MASIERSPSYQDDYEAPRIERLGTLAELTLGLGGGGPDFGSELS